MNPPQPFSPAEAWKPLDSSRWNESAARHLLHRIGFSSSPEALAQALDEGIERTIDRAFNTFAPLTSTESLEHLESMRGEAFERRKEAKTPEEKQKLNKEVRMAQNQAYEDFALHWLDFALNTERSAQEKWVLFIQDVVVVARSKVKGTLLLYEYQKMLRENALGSYPELLKAVARSPSMIQYLDLRLSKKEAPNENFARELFELFTLGEGNYTEQDIKEAARAFTGHRINAEGEWVASRKDFDRSSKTVFGKTGNWDGDQVIDLVFEQPAASTFLPRELLRYYLTVDTLPEVWIEELGRLWKQSGFNLRFLAKTVFSSQVFYDAAFVGNRIKSPLEFYIGLQQDLVLSIAPLPSKVLSRLRAMGQAFFDPPNVRGWQYGRNWISSTSLSARRQTVQQLFTDINVEKLNADDRKRLEAAEASGKGPFTVSRQRLESIAGKPSREIAEHFCRYFLSTASSNALADELSKHIGDSKGEARINRIKEALIALLQSAYYQLC